MLMAVMGLGAGGLRVFGVWHALCRRDKIAFAIPLGFGLLGWLMFFAGIGGFLSDGYLAGLLAVCALGAMQWRSELAFRFRPPRSPWWWAAFAGLVLVIALNVVNAVPPPTDADSMAYHFAVPKQFLADGRITFIPRAVSGAAPLLVQSTYMPALGLGGEWGLTFWTMLSGLLAGAVFYLAARRYLNEAWSLVLTLVVLTVPAVLYGAGSGQVEVRNMMFVMAAALALADGLRTGNPRFFLLAGAAAGFFAAAKYIGLMFVAAAGLTVLRSPRWLVHGLLFGLAAIATGAQWYFWNWWHTGDPVFPMLFEFLGLPDSDIWTAAYDRYFHAVFPGTAEIGVPQSVFWFFAYPVKATFYPSPVFESARTGFGVIAMVLAPLSVGGVWIARKALFRHPLFAIGLVALIFYALWFFTGSSQRIRHLLPIYPLVLLCLAVAAHRFAEAIGALRIMAIGVAVVLVIQLGGLAVFSKNALQFIIRNDTRDAYLERVLKDYAAARWINDHLGPTDRVALLRRTLFYYLDVPYLFIHHQFQTQVDISPQSRNPARYLKQLRVRGVTHVLYARHPGERSNDSGLLWLTERLIAAGDAKVVGRIKGVGIASRTLSSMSAGSDYEIRIVELRDGAVR